VRLSFRHGFTLGNGCSFGRGDKIGDQGDEQFDDADTGVPPDVLDNLLYPI